MPAIEFPRLLLREQTSAWQIKSSTMSIGQAASGAFPRVRTDGGGLWTAEYGSINLRTPDHVRLWRAMEVLCDGGATPVVVPMCDKRQFPAPIVDGAPVYGFSDIPHSDETPFSDGAGYDQNVVSAAAAFSALRRAVTLVIAFESGSPLRGGEFFSIEHPTQGWHLYQIGAVEIVGGNSLVTFRPPLREAVSAGEHVEFDDPRCVMMLADPNSMKLTMTRRRFANPDVSFYEYFYPTA